MTAQDREEFKQYLKACTDRQVLGVVEKENADGRDDYESLARDEAKRREILL